MDGTSSKQIFIIFSYILDKYHCKTIVLRFAHPGASHSEKCVGCFKHTLKITFERLTE